MEKPTPSQPDKENQKEPSALEKIWVAISIPLVAVLVAMLFGAIIIASNGIDPIRAYSSLFRGAFGDMVAFGRTLEKATPLLFSGLAVSFAFKAGLFNIGAQGQLLFGGITAAAIGFGVHGLPTIIHLPLALLGGALAGALYGIIPGILKTSTGAHEVITTIMLNYIAINMTDYLADGPWKDTSASNIVARTPQILDTAVIPRLAQLPLGFFLAVGIAILVWWVLEKSTLGFEIRTAGLNPRAARYSGIKVARIIVLTMVLSGFLAGMGGAVETMGVIGRYQPGFNLGLGFEGITVALLGKTHPIGNIFAAILIGALKAGSSLMQRVGVDPEITSVLQALMLFFVAADVLIRRFIHVRAVESAPNLSSHWGDTK
ncbi:MAG: ABC transporter permease [Anaerolineales bacterium]